ncbi:hypothetical protein Btru_061752 [Bulinus truncatus]|nr:hypothetical protein Btru_061752 [Bulinus truncatus]
MEKKMQKSESSHNFDASKFRAANKGELKKDFSLMKKEDSRTSGYRDHSLEDIGVKRIDDRVLYKDSPQYDKEELDLMKQLEEEL